MKLKGAKQVHYDSGPNMTPLVDVVMVILIFLMLAGSFGTAEHFMASAVPIHAKGVGGVPPPQDWKPADQLDVQVSANGDASILGVLNHEPDPDKVKDALEAKLAQFKAAMPRPKQAEEHRGRPPPDARHQVGGPGPALRRRPAGQFR